MAVMPRQILLAGHAGEHQMQRQRDLRAGLHAHQHAFVGKRSIQARKDLIAAVEAAAQQLLRLVACSQRCRQGVQLHAFRQRGQITERLGWAAIDEDQAWRRNVVQRGGIHQRGHQRGRLKAAPFQLPQRGVFPGLGTRAGQAGLQGGIELGAACVTAAETARQGIEQGAHQAATSGTTRSFRKW